MRRRVKQLTLNGEVIQTLKTQESAIPPGKIKCVVTGKLRKDTPEERVRQEIARELIEVYGYSPNDMEVEFPIKMGREKNGQT